MPEDSLSVTFIGPILAKRGTLDIDFPKGWRDIYGLYLWTVEYEGGYLVHYVGKTIRPFYARFRDHKIWSEGGKDICDPDFMPKGENWLLDNPTMEQTIRLYECYRIFLAPVEVDDNTLMRIENAIIQELLSAGGKCKDFLGNKQKRIRVKAGSKVLIQKAALIHGLGDSVEI